MTLEWISVNERLPEPHEKVIVQYGDQNVLIGILDSSNEWAIYWRDGLSVQDYERPITHWMPLPEPPNITLEEKSVTAMKLVMDEMMDALEHSRNQMNKARQILQETSGGNWGMFDSSKQEKALSKYNELFKK